MYRVILMLTGLLALPAGYLATRPLRATIPPAAEVPGPVHRSGRASGDSLASSLVARDPFRAERSPALVLFNPLPGEPVGAEPKPPKPPITVSGIVWGAEPSAVVEGLPGMDGGHLMRVGDVAAGIRLRRITASQVVLSGMDTTWTLSVRRPW